VASINGLVRFTDPRAMINGLFDNVRSMSEDTRILERHAAHLDAIDERLEHIVELMERMVKAVEELQESVEPIGRVANRIPGRSKR
jgi:methyl-accepting chemotaxis protein